MTKLPPYAIYRLFEIAASVAESNAHTIAEKKISIGFNAAAISNSRYIAYGGSFVIYYILVILHDRYFEDIYCLYPYEWIQFQHNWLFDEQGIVILLSSLSVLLFLLYYNTVRRCIERV